MRISFPRANDRAAAPIFRSFRLNMRYRAAPNMFPIKKAPIQKSICQINLRRRTLFIHLEKVEFDQRRAHWMETRHMCAERNALPTHFPQLYLRKCSDCIEPVSWIICSSKLNNIFFFSAPKLILHRKSWRKFTKSVKWQIVNSGK